MDTQLVIATISALAAVGTTALSVWSRRRSTSRADVLTLCRDELDSLRRRYDEKSRMLDRLESRNTELEREKTELLVQVARMASERRRAETENA